MYFYTIRNYTVRCIDMYILYKLNTAIGAKIDFI